MSPPSIQIHAILYLNTQVVGIVFENIVPSVSRSVWHLSCNCIVDGAVVL